MSIKVLENGWELGVHIADVSHYVIPGNSLDKEAYERATSVYLPDRVLPMLPEELSNGICSLKQDEDRLTVSAFMVFDSQGIMKSWRFARVIIRSVRRLTYTQVQAFLDGRESIPGQNKRAEIEQTLLEMQKLALLRRKKRVGRGALDFDFPETKIEIDENGVPLRLFRMQRAFFTSIDRRIHVGCQ